MINFQMKECELYKNVPVKNSVGETIDNWIFVEKIFVAINQISIKQMNDDIRYKDCQFTGLTEYKGFTLHMDYKLVCGNDEYLIKDINQISRLTQLTMQVIV